MIFQATNTPPPPPPSPTSSGTTSQAWIAGPVVGSVVGAAILVLLGFLVGKRRRARAAPSRDAEFSNEIKAEPSVAGPPTELPLNIPPAELALTHPAVELPTDEANGYRSVRQNS